MGKIFYTRFINCFLCYIFLCKVVLGQTFEWTEENTRAYYAASALDYQQAKKLLKVPSSKLNGIDVLVSDYIDFLELLITENRSRYEQLNEQEQFRLDKIKKLDKTSPYYLFIQAEIKLHWAIINAKLGHQWSAFWRIRQAYNLLKLNVKKFPNFLPNKKSLGAFKVFFSSMPAQYHWAMRLFGMNPNVSAGLKNMEQAARGKEPLAWEAAIVKACLQIYFLNQCQEPFKILYQLHLERPRHIGLQFVCALAAAKAGQTLLAICLLEGMTTKEREHLLVPTHYLKAILYLEYGDYAKSISSAKRFLAIYRGENYIKDTYYRLFLASWFSGLPEAKAYLQNIRKSGTIRTVLDAYAEKFTYYTSLPHQQIMQARLFTDGHFFDKAAQALARVDVQTLTNKKDKLAYYYRLARLKHKQGKYREAERFYLRTIELHQHENYYFAANAYLQLGYIFKDQYRDLKKATRYFKKVLSYKKHEYKSSLDIKAKTALHRISHR